MKQQQVPTAVAVAVALSLSAMMTLTTPALAQSDDQPVYGSQLMSDQERQTYRSQMRNAATPEERERIRTEHHEQMQKRAKEQGVTLPEMPRQGMGQGQGMQQGQGQGMQQGQGMGQGQGMQQGQGMKRQNRDANN